MAPSDMRRTYWYWVVVLGLLVSPGACRSKPSGEAAALRGDAVPHSDAAGFCSQGGRFSAVTGEGRCPPIEQLSVLGPESVSIGHTNTAYKGALPKCPGFDPQEGGKGFKIKFRVDQVEEKSFMIDNGRGTAVVLETWVHGANLDASPLCGHMLVFRSGTERPTLEPGRVLHAAQRLVVRSDQDAPNAHVLADEDGRVLYAEVTGEHAARFDSDFGDLFPNLRIEPGDKAVCFAADISRTLTTLGVVTSGDKGCVVDSHSQACCTLWSTEYEVQVLNAFAPKQAGDSVWLGFTIRRRGFFTKR